VPYAVGLYITAAYWFTASTSFANRPSRSRAVVRYFRGDCALGRAGVDRGSAHRNADGSLVGGWLWRTMGLPTSAALTNFVVGIEGAAKGSGLSPPKPLPPAKWRAGRIRQQPFSSRQSLTRSAGTWKAPTACYCWFNGLREIFSVSYPQTKPRTRAWQTLHLRYRSRAALY
jgi:hypothetical protein